MEAWGFAVVVYDSYGAPANLTQHGNAYIVVRNHVPEKKIPSFSGAVILDKPVIKTAEDWCGYHGADIEDGNAVLFKAVDDDWSTDNARRANVFYVPGTAPEAPDWDGGAKECGGGLHFSPSPTAALYFNSGATKFVRCLVPLDDIAVHPNGQYPQKVKAPRAVAVAACDRFGDLITDEVPA
jgi:hypothetical protein